MTTITAKACQHCSAEFVPTEAGEAFCCGGCAFVHHLIREEGFGQYYTLKGGRITAPVKSVALQKRDYTWLQEAASQAESKAANGVASLELAVQGISCVACVWLMERLFLRQPGALRARARASPGRLTLQWKAAACDIPAFADELRRFGYLLGPADAAERPTNAFSGRTGICGAFAMNAMAFSLPRYLGMEANFALAGIFTMAAGVCATLAVLTGGSYFISRAAKSLSNGVLHIDVPVAAGILAAYVGSLIGWLLQVESLIYFDFVAVFTFLMLSGRRLQMAAVERNRGRLLGGMTPSLAPRDASGAPLPVERLAPELPFIVLPGQIVPVAARLRAGEATVSLESINGEAEPRHFGVGGRLAAGSLNIGREPLDLEALESWDASLFRRLRETREGEARHPTLDRILRYSISAVLIVSVSAFIGWWSFTGDIARALQVMVSLLVVSCPCALGVALPLADELAAARMERFGVYVRRAVFWPRLRRVRKLLFDKTGTLTLESPLLENPQALRALSQQAKSALAALTADSLHPVSRSLTEILAAEGIQSSGQSRVSEVVGQGVCLEDDRGAIWSLGKPGWKSPADSEGDAIFACDGVPIAGFRFRDAMRPDVSRQMDWLRQRGFEIHLLSGDQAAKVKSLAKELGVPESQAHGFLTPDQKAQIVRRLDQGDTLYIGDGMNDALAFQAAACTGTPVVDKGLLENQADFYFLGRGLRFLAPLLRTAELRAHAVASVATFAVLYNLAAASLCLLGKMNPLLAAILMPLSGLATLSLVYLFFRASPTKWGNIEAF